MRVLIAEDDFVARQVLKEQLSVYGECDIVVDGSEAIDAFRIALDDRHPYDLICMDIMMPTVDGREAVERIRSIERERGISNANESKIVMITALGDPKTVVDAFYKFGATAYIVKPVDNEKLREEIRNLGLIP